MRNGCWPLLLTTWIAAVGFGLWTMLDYELTPASVDQAADQWPVDSNLSPSATRPTLLMFVHPQCPCSRASLDELSVLASRRPEQSDVVVVFVKPPGFDDAWVRSALWRMAEAIPGATLYSDVDGTEARRFRANTSGETFLYSPERRLLFHGGLTASRGHRGDNAGRAAVEALLSGNATAQHQTPVFGCCLHDRQCTVPVSPQHTDSRDSDDENER